MNAKTQFTVKFRTVGIVQESQLGDLMARVESAQAILMTPYDYSGAEAPAPEPKASKAGKKY